MIDKRIQIAPGQRLTLVELAEDAVISGWDQPDALIHLPEGTEEDVTVEETEAGPAVSVRRACEVRVPAALPLAIRQAQAHLKVSEISNLAAEQVRGHLKLAEVGEAAIAEVYGHLKACETATLRVMGTVFGDASLQEVETADLQNVRGSLRAKECTRLRTSRIGGDLAVKELGATLQADEVGGNAILKDIAGAVAVSQVAGNLVAKRLQGGVSVGRIGGNLMLGGELGTGCTYQFKVDGNAVLRLPQGTGVHLALVAKGRIQVPAAVVAQERTEQTLSGTVGGGGAEVAIEAKGNIMIGNGHTEADADWGEAISRQVEESLRGIDFEGIGRQVSEEMGAALSRLRVKMEGMDWGRMGQQAQQSVERAIASMEREMSHVTERAARQQERVQHAAEREARRQERWEQRFRTPRPQPVPEVDLGIEIGVDAGASPAAEPAPSLDEERMTILRMVEQGQIRPEEAEMLLDALE